MNIKYHTKTEHYLSIDDLTFEIPFSNPIAEHTIMEKTTDGYVLGILYQDTDYEPNRMFTDEDGNGKILSFHRHVGTAMHEEAYRAMGRYANLEDPDERIPAAPIFRLLSCYSHSGESWGLVGEVQQCNFDTAQIAGVWVPDKCAEENIEIRTAGLSEDGKKLAIDAYVRNVIDTYNSYLSGEVYGICFAHYDLGRNLVDEVSCWGYVGWKGTIAEMKSQLESDKAHR